MVNLREFIWLLSKAVFKVGEVNHLPQANEFGVGLLIASYRWMSAFSKRELGYGSLPHLQLVWVLAAPCRYSQRITPAVFLGRTWSNLWAWEIVAQCHTHWSTRVLCLRHCYDLNCGKSFQIWLEMDSKHNSVAHKAFHSDIRKIYSLFIPCYSFALTISHPKWELEEAQDHKERQWRHNIPER